MRAIPVAVLLLIGLSAGAGGAGCGSPAHTPPAAQTPPAAPPPPPLDRFSGERAFEDLEALAAIGPRPSGSDGTQRARAYLRAQLEAAGLPVEEVGVRVPPGSEAPDAEPGDTAERTPPETLRHLVVTLPGASDDRFVLLAPYDTRRVGGPGSDDYVGANDAASGAALLLEVARVLSTRSLPYTTRLVFLEGEGGADPSGDAAPEPRWQGARALAQHWLQSGELDRVRLLVAFHRVGDADLRIARDLASHRMYREEFFRAAGRLGRQDAFPREQGFESVEASHRPFREAGLRAALAISDTHYGGDTSPGLFAETVDDTAAQCAPQSLAIVGAVTLEALETIGARLAKIDRFARSPLDATGRLAAEPTPLLEPEADATGAAPPGGDAALPGESGEER